MINIKNLSKTFSVIKISVLFVLLTSVLCSCVGYVGPGERVPGHYNRFGQWVPAHFVASPVVGATVAPGGSVWVPGHYGRFGQWIPGHWR